MTLPRDEADRVTMQKAGSAASIASPDYIHTLSSGVTFLTMDGAWAVWEAMSAAQRDFSKHGGSANE